jgi:hypothetical protein
MNIQKQILFYAIAIILLVSSCKLGFRHKGITEGSIKYKITYIEDEQKNPIVSLLPEYITMTFKETEVLLSVEGWMGIFKSVFIKDKDQNAITLLKILNKKYLYRSESGIGYYGLTRYDDMEVIFDDIEKKIIDFDCKHARVRIPARNLDFDVYYTNDIKINNPNANTPLYQIPGVLIEFKMEMNGILMHLEATEFSGQDVPEDFFKLPQGYKEVARAQMDSIFKEIKLN